MTSDELWELIQCAIENERQNGIDDRTHQTDLAGSVIAALAAAGLVIGERVELTSDTDKHILDNVFGFGLALVRVVTPDG